MKSDKKRNCYEVTVEDYNKIMLNNITQLYRKCDQEDIDLVNKDAKKLGDKMELSHLRQNNATCQCCLNYL